MKYFKTFIIQIYFTFCTPYACLAFQMALGNVLYYHNRNLMEHFEFLDGLRMICLPLNISEKLHLQHLFKKLGEAETQELLKNNIDHSRKRGKPPFFHQDTNTVLGHVLVYSVDKTHVLVVTAKLNWLLFLNILSLNFVPAPTKSLRLVQKIQNRLCKLLCNCFNQPLPKLHWLFCLMCAVQSGSVHFFAAVCPQ